MNLTQMTICMALAVAGAAAGQQAVRLDMGGAGEPAFADLETSATFSLPPAAASNWRLALSLAGTPSNCVEVAFGRDANTNAVLDAEEITAAIGWDRGVWFVVGGPGLEERFTATPSGDTLTLDVYLTAAGVMRPAAVREGNSPLPFADMQPVPAWLDPRKWNTARLTVRGGGVRAESAAVTAFPDRTLIWLK